MKDIPWYLPLHGDDLRRELMDVWNNPLVSKAVKPKRASGSSACVSAADAIAKLLQDVSEILEGEAVYAASSPAEIEYLIDEIEAGRMGSLAWKTCQGVHTGKGAKPDRRFLKMWSYGTRAGIGKTVTVFPRAALIRKADILSI